MRILKFQSGFTLIEIAIVLVIVSILLGYTVAMFPIQQELKRYRQAESEMNEILDHLVGFAQVNGRLPCPDTSGNGGTIDGQEDELDAIDNVTGAIAPDSITDDCLAFAGFLPAETLGINGDFDSNGRLLDPWGEPYRYHVSDINSNADSNVLTAAAIDLVSPNGVREEGLSNISPDLIVCDDSDNSSAADANCVAVSSNPVVTNIAAVLISTGKDHGNIASNIQGENTDDFHDGTNDKVYTYSQRSDTAGTEYDDIVKWISANTLFSKMIDAGQLP